MTLVRLALAAAMACSLVGHAHAQPLGPSTDGPVIRGYGAVFDPPTVDLPTPTGMEYRVVFDVSQSAEEAGDVNPYLNSVARFLNMHARAGVPRENLHVAVVLHGSAGKDALREDPFQQRYGRANRNLDLIRQLAEAGVELYMCGQTAMSRGLPADELAEPVKMALSAMTARAALEARGFRPVN